MAQDPLSPGTGPFIPPTVISASSATNAWVFADTVGLTTRASHWNGSRWASFSFPRNSATTSAAVFSRTEVWAFGEIVSAYPQPYVVRFNGSRWLRVPSPLLPQDASALATPDHDWLSASPSQCWAYSSPLAARWRSSSRYPFRASQRIRP